MITQLDHIALAVNDLSTSLTDYQRLLGQAPLWVHNRADRRQAWFQLQNLGLLLVAPNTAHDDDPVRRQLARSGEGLWTVAFAVRNAQDARTHVTRRALRTLAIPNEPYLLGPEDAAPLVMIDPEDTAGVVILLVERPAASHAVGSVSAAKGGVVDLDHLVILTDQPDRAAALYGARLGLDLRLDRSNAAWGVRQMFFRCDEMIVEVVASLSEASRRAEDRFGGLAWRVSDVVAAQARLTDEAFDVSTVRHGRKAGSKVLTVRRGVAGAPSLIIEQGVRDGV